MQRHKKKMMIRGRGYNFFLYGDDSSVGGYKPNVLLRIDAGIVYI